MPKILALQSSPVDQVQLRLNEEVRHIRACLAFAPTRSFSISSHGATRPTDIQPLLQSEPADILHFSGHGTAGSELVLEDASGNGKPVPPQALAQTFRILGGQIRCVVLNSCYSARQAKAIADYVDCVVGMTSAVSDPTAIAFAGSFYRALAFGYNVQQAVDLGKLDVALEGYADSKVVKLHTRVGVDASQVSFGEPPPTIHAEFVLRGDRPKKKSGEYVMTLSVKNVPSGALSVVYQFVDTATKSIRPEDEFAEIVAEGRDFECGVSFYGDVRIRATVWYENRGIATVTWLSNALERSYETTTSTPIRQAIDDIRHE